MIGSAISLLCIGSAFMFGYGVGWTKGYDKSDEDSQQIKSEMDGLWKEVEAGGLRDRSVPGISIRVGSAKL
jgi:hypothetical protein